MKSILFLLFSCLLGLAQAQTVITSSTQRTWSLPADWDDASNELECIGAAGTGTELTLHGAGGGCAFGNGVNNGGAGGLYGGGIDGHRNCQTRTIAEAQGITVITHASGGTSTLTPNIM